MPIRTPLTAILGFLALAGGYACTGSTGDGGAAIPVGYFACGDHACAKDSQYCLQTIETDAKKSCDNTFSCVPIPTCDAASACSCIKDSLHADLPTPSCYGDAESGIQVLYAPSC